MAIRRHGKEWKRSRTHELEFTRELLCMTPVNEPQARKKLNIVREQIEKGHYEQPEVLNKIASYILEQYRPQSKKFFK